MMMIASVSDWLLFDAQGLLGQMTGRQTGIDALRKAAESLIACEGDLLSNTDEIQESVGKSVSQPTDHETDKSYKIIPLICHYESMF